MAGADAAQAIVAAIQCTVHDLRFMSPPPCRFWCRSGAFRFLSGHDSLRVPRHGAVMPTYTPSPSGRDEKRGEWTKVDEDTFCYSIVSERQGKERVSGNNGYSGRCAGGSPEPFRTMPCGMCSICAGRIQTMWLKARSLLLFALIFAAPVTSFAQVAVSITVAPPAIPVYAQPLCPAEGFLWTPGLLGYGAVGYYWVPACGSPRRGRACCGRPAIGHLRAALQMARGIVGCTSATTAESAMASATAAPGSRGTMGRRRIPI